MATLEKMMGRGRKHTAPMMKLDWLRAVQEHVDLQDVDEVRARGDHNRGSRGGSWCEGVSERAC
eukprot:3157788-Prymnesium_polylepis.2